MKKILLVIALILNSILTIGQEYSKESAEQLLKKDLEDYKAQLKHDTELILNKVDQKENMVEKYGNGNPYFNSSQESGIDRALARSRSKVASEVFTGIKESDVYEDMPDGTRRMKYPFIPGSANSIEEVEQYFKEHPSEMSNFNTNENQSIFSNENESNSENEYYSENGFAEKLSSPFGIITILIVIFFLIAEFIGRSKHIGRWWTFFLLLSGILPGIVALIASPSAKNNPTKGAKSYNIWGWICLVFGILNTIILIGSKGKTGQIFFAFFILSYYLFELSKGKIVNNNPKYYFDSLSLNKTISSNQSYPKKTIIPLKSNEIEANLTELKNNGVLSELEHNTMLKKLKEEE